MTVPSGGFVAIVGPSGSGKSSLLHCAAGLEDVDCGQVLVDGLEITALTRAQRAAHRREHIGFIFQEHNLIDSLTVRDNVMLPLRLRRQRSSDAAVDAAIAQVGLTESASHRPHQLSGGEQQRVAIARVLVSKPQLVFADEPTGSLDVANTAQVLDWLRQLPNSGASVVMVTHDPAAAALADHVLVMEPGRITTVLPGGDADLISRAVLHAQVVHGC